MPKLYAAGESGLPRAPVFRIAEMPDRSLYVGTEAGAFRLQGDRFVPLSPLLPNDGVTSFTKDASGALVPAWHISEVTASLNGKPVLVAHWGPAVSKNPYLQFKVKGAKAGAVRRENCQCRATDLPPGSSLAVM